MPQKKLPKYELCTDVPEGITWKPSCGKRAAVPKTVTMLSIGNIYKLVRTLATGEVVYYKAIDTGPEKSPAESIDAEPVKKAQVRYRVGKQCWFVLPEGWFLCEVTRRTGGDRATFGEPKRIAIKSVTGWDATRTVAWPHPEEIEFVAQENNPMFARLLPLNARQV